MSYKENEEISVQCEKIKGTAQLILTYLNVEVDQLTSSVSKKLISFDCLNKQNCGIARENKDGSIDYHWEECFCRTKYDNQ